MAAMSFVQFTPLEMAANHELRIILCKNRMAIDHSLRNQDLVQEMGEGRERESRALFIRFPSPTPSLIP